MTPVLVAVLGAIGSLCRYGVSVALERFAGRGIPLATFVVNVVGSLLIGVVMTWFSLRGGIDSRERIALTVGFLGGFTTYSSFAFETWVLFEEGSHGRAALNVMGTVIICFAACALGVIVTRKLGRV